MLILDPIAQLRLSDPHEARALEFERVGNTKKANRIRQCWRNPHNLLAKKLGRTRGCRDRQCPSCAGVDSTQKAWSVKDAILRMDRPEHWVAHVYSAPAKPRDLKSMTAALGGAVEAAAGALSKLKRRAAFKSVVDGGVQVLEATYKPAWGRWDVHYHLILDTEDLDEGDADAIWKRLVGHGRLVRDPDGVIDTVEEAKRIAYYITKTKDWAPDPSEEDAVAIEARSRAFKYKQRVVYWGSARAPSTEHTE